MLIWNDKEGQLADRNQDDTLIITSTNVCLLPMIFQHVKSTWDLLDLLETPAILVFYSYQFYNRRSEALTLRTLSCHTGFSSPACLISWPSYISKLATLAPASVVWFIFTGGYLIAKP